jgi:LysM domain-containing protein
VTERGLPIADGAPACPFVAFEDDRDERATEPDHRHRCYADVRPAPRALAHQAAYCLSSAFPVCPTFQDWARREAARARDAAASAAAEVARVAPAQASQPPTTDDAATPESAPPPAAARAEGDAAATSAAAVAGADADASDPAGAVEADAPSDGPGFDEESSDDEPHDDDGPRRNPPREWSAPPPWLASAEAARAKPSEAPDFLAGRSDPTRGLAGSAADLLAGGSPPRPAPPPHLAAPADLPGQADGVPDFEARDLPRPAAPRRAATARRPRAYDQHLGGPTTGPDWERPKRYEAYPTIRTRMGLPSIPRLAGMAAAVALAAVALFFLPALLGLGANDGPGASPSRSPSPSQSIAPTPTPAPTPVVYIIKKGDTLSKIAVAHGLTTDQLMAANPTIKDPNKIIIGQQIIIPPPPSAVPDEFGGSGSPSASASP